MCNFVVKNLATDCLAICWLISIAVTCINIYKHSDGQVTVPYICTWKVNKRKANILKLLVYCLVSNS